jgi:hypothetical protein
MILRVTVDLVNAATRIGNLWFTVGGTASGDAPTRSGSSCLRGDHRATSRRAPSATARK